MAGTRSRRDAARIGQGHEIAGAEARLASLTSAMAAAGAADESLLQQITSLAADVESALAASQFRFDAAQAYRELVEARIGELRERRLPAIQPIGEFIERRFGPAMRTCRATAHRLHDLSERVGRTSTLLSTRVGIVRERRNQALLASMDQRAKHQLRLQQAVESLSLVAIVYYAAGLVGYIVKAMRDLGANIAQDTMVGASVPLLAVIAIVASRLVRHHTNARGTA
jgi:uncharacterized membrane-anchored protein